jgi:two-component system response regulator FixJ
MPRKTGLELLKDLRSFGFETPFVFLSGYGDKAKVTEALRLGALDFLDKPFDDQLVLSVMGRALEYGKSLREFDEFFRSIVSKINLPEDEIQKFREAKKQIWMIRFESDFKTKRRGA